MPPSVLVDTGALLALLDKSDRWHRSCLAAFQQIRLPLLTSEAVLTELFHLACDSPHEMEEVWRLLRSGAVQLAAIENAELPAIHALMSRYADRPMDFADATLVYLAKREGAVTVFTVDHADFSTYRIEGTRRFRVIPVLTPK
jgi:predicted nucleic acid-binding protein